MTKLSDVELARKHSNLSHIFRNHREFPAIGVELDEDITCCDFHRGKLSLYDEERYSLFCSKCYRFLGLEYKTPRLDDKMAKIEMEPEQLIILVLTIEEERQASIGNYFKIEEILNEAGARLRERFGVDIRSIAANRRTVRSGSEHLLSHPEVKALPQLKAVN